MAIAVPVDLGRAEACYHRVESVSSVTNEACYVTVAHYASRRVREAEMAAIAEAPGGRLADGDAFVLGRSFHEAPWADGRTAAGWYGWLKGLPEYEGAEDVIEGEGDDGR